MPKKETLRKETALFYDTTEGRWCVDLHRGTYHFHCGESFRMRLGEQMVYCQLEYDDGWYVIVGNNRLDLRPGATYMVAI